MNPGINIDRTYYKSTIKSVNNYNGRKKSISGYTFPLDPERHSIASDFGYRLHPIYKEVMLHKGIDFRGHTGDDIVAANNGKVVSAGWATGFGYFVKLEHDDGKISIYGHLQKNPTKEPFYLKKGISVKAGQPIGFIGSTGVSTGPHLHFEIRDKNGESINPLYVLPELATPEQRLQKYIADNLVGTDHKTFMKKNIDTSDSYFDGVISTSSKFYLDKLISKITLTNDVNKLKELSAYIEACGKRTAKVVGLYQVKIASAIDDINKAEDMKFRARFVGYDNQALVNDATNLKKIDEGVLDLMYPQVVENFSLNQEEAKPLQKLTKPQLQEKLYALLPESMKKTFYRQNHDSKGQWDGNFQSSTYFAVKYLSYQLGEEKLAELRDAIKMLDGYEKMSLAKYADFCDNRIANIKLQQTIKESLPDNMVAMFVRKNSNHSGELDGLIGPSTTRYLNLAAAKSPEVKNIIQSTLPQYVSMLKA